MLTVEEYIAKRKKEDNINEFDLNERNDNIRLCVNYVFEYFNNYLDITEVEEKTVLKDEKLEKYRNQFKEYDTEVGDWLVEIFSEYNKQINRIVANILKKNEFFYIYNSDSEFREVSYDCYSKIIKKLPFLKGKTEMLFHFIKEYHRVMSQRSIENGIPSVTEEIDEWIQNTWEKYQVNILEFVYGWIIYFEGNDSIWPSTHRKKSKYSFRQYDYDYKQKSNLFNIDSLYRKMPKKPYTRGRKQEFEILMMYYWLHDIEGDEEGYWEEYLKKTCPS